jgi:hypothetical protein
VKYERTKARASHSPVEIEVWKEAQCCSANINHFVLYCISTVQYYMQLEVIYIFWKMSRTIPSSLPLCLILSKSIAHATLERESEKPRTQKDRIGRDTPFHFRSWFLLWSWKFGDD